MSKEMPASVKDKLNACIEGFRGLRSRLNDPARTQIDQGLDAGISNEYDRLNLWACDVNAWNGGLDKALTSSSSLRDCTVDLLSELHEQLSSLVTVPNCEFLDEIKDIVDNLISIEPALGSPAPLDDLRQKESEVCSALLSTDEETTRLVTQAQKSRFVTGKPDLDIVVVPGLLGDASWGSQSSRHLSAQPDWLKDLLLTILEENGIYVRIMTFYYDSPSWLGGTNKRPPRLGVDEFVVRTANKLVQELNKARLKDPERPMFFVSHSMGGVITKEATLTLIKEGLSVNSDRPICGCMFFAVPHDTKEENLVSWLASFISARNEAPSTEALYFQMQFIALKNKLFSELSQERGVKLVNTYMQKGKVTTTDSMTESDDALNYDRNSRFDLLDREAVLPVVHRIASIAEKAMSDQNEQRDLLKESPFPHSPRLSINQSEDPFAMLVAYDTAILVNDSSSISPSTWTSIIEIVRDCVDIVIGYRDDLDLQLYRYESTSFSVTESAKASRILAGIRPPGVAWDLDAQLRRYVRKYLASDSSILPGGTLRPCNVIVLTDHPPDQSPNSFLETLSSLIEQSSSLPSGQLQLCMQFVLLGEDSAAIAFFNQLDSLVTTTRLPCQQVSKSSLYWPWVLKFL
jgi:hypothetical protein